LFGREGDIDTTTAFDESRVNGHTVEALGRAG
jgi:hypothetical protein